MLDLVLIHPGAQHGIYGALGDRLTALEPPTWARMIAGYLRDRGVNLVIVDAEALRLSPERAAEYVHDLRPRLTAIVVSGHQPSASTQQMVGASATARAVKKLDPGLRVLMCGNHPSALPERTLREEAVDYVADGEAVVTIEKLLDDSTPTDSIPGLVWRVYLPHDRIDIVRNPLPPLVTDLDRDLHGDTWDLLPMDRYRAHNWHAWTGSRQPYASTYTSLNCPFACSFCMISTLFHNHKYRTFSPDFIVNQVRRLRDRYGVASMKLADEMFVLNPSHYLAVADGLAATGFADELNLWAYARVDTVQPEHLARLRAGGVRWLALGIESASAYVRDGANKRLRRDDVVDVVRTIQDAGINVVGNYIFGLRDDTLATMSETLDLALAANTEWANFYCAMAYPGSRLYDEALASGWALPATWRGYSQHNDDCRPLDTETVPATEVLRFRDAAFRTYFSSPAYRATASAKFGPSVEADLDQMLSYELKRKLLT